MQQIVKFSPDEIKSLFTQHLSAQLKGFDCSVESVVAEGDGLIVKANLSPLGKKKRSPRKLVAAGSEASNG